MSNINRNNYEAFLLDYVEQNLSPEMVAELMLFLEQNPDLKAELEAFENTSFASEQLETFEHKADLKQAAVEELMIAELEGLNTAQETAQLNEAIKANEAYAALFARYQKTILVPEQVVFSDKNSLKHKDTKVVPIYWWVSSAAAVLFVVFTLNPFVTDNNNNISSVDTRMLPIENAQSSVGSSQSSDNSSQSSVGSSQLAAHSSQPTVNSSKSSVHSFHSSVNNNKKPATSNQQPATNKKMIEIEPLQEKEYIEIYPSETLSENNTEEKSSKEFLTVSELLKKEAQKRLLENEVKTSSKELVAANVVAKVLGNNAEVETTEDASGEVKEYALNIGGFSFSRKIRK
jgi:anti-sigma factor RsiW